uniref:glutamate formimidoyltransferase n=2 Tax=Zea mays TaxID=4577 RepID=A0A804R405_MAIZE
MLRPPALACCKLYISEARNSGALRAIEHAAAALRPLAVLVNTFADDAYNRVGYTLVSPLAGGAASPPLRCAAFRVVAAAIEAVDLDAHAGAHPRLGVVDHIAFHPLASARLEDVTALARAVAADIGDRLQAVPTYLYGAAHRDGRTLASIRRQLGYFTPTSPGGEQWHGAPDSLLPVAPDAGPRTSSASNGVVVVGATPWVDNYNVPLATADVSVARRIARAVSERGGGLACVQAMGLAHGDGATEVACNLLHPDAVGADQVQERVSRLAAGLGVGVGQGYFTDFSREKVVELYLQAAQAA